MLDSFLFIYPVSIHYEQKDKAVSFINLGSVKMSFIDQINKKFLR